MTVAAGQTLTAVAGRPDRARRALLLLADHEQVPAGLREELAAIAGGQPDPSAAPAPPPAKPRPGPSRGRAGKGPR